MSCCGQKRMQWQHKKQDNESIQVSHEPILKNPVPIKYNGSGSYLIKGAGTGYLYLFAANEPGLMIDERDVPLLLEKSGFFSLSENKI